MISYGITLILLGLLAVPSLLLKKEPDAQEWFDKVTPYQGWIGVLFAFYGIWGIIDCILHLNFLTAGFGFLIIWLTQLLVSLIEADLGFIFGYNLIQKYVLSKNENTAAKGEQLLAKLLPLQSILGIASICLGVWAIVAHIIWWV